MVPLWLLLPFSLSMHGGSWLSKPAGASLVIRDDSSSAYDIPSMCYDACNQMAYDLETMETEGLSKNCSSSSLLPELRECYDCAKGMKNETAFANWIQTAIDECVLGESITASEVLTSTTSQTSASATQASTTQASATQASSQSSNPSPEAHSNTTTIVPAVVVPVVVGLAAALFFVFIKRRQRKRSITYPTSPPPLEYKAQLHADDFRPELDGSSTSGERPKVVNEMLAGPVVNHDLVELPAGEVAEEMGANHENR